MRKGQKLSKADVKKGIKYSVRDGAAVSVRDNIFSNYLVPFALLLGAGPEAIGFLSAIPQLAAALMSPLVGKMIEYARRRKAMCTKTMLASHLLWLPVAFLPFLVAGTSALWIFLALLIVSQAARNVASISWSAWIADIVPKKIRGAFFGKRNMAASISALAAILFGGWVLGITNDATGFAILFVTAVLFGLISVSYLRKMPEAAAQVVQRRFSFSFSDVAGTFKGNTNFRNYTLMAFFFNFAVYFASPFFVVYMLTTLNIGYEWYAIVLAVESIIYTLSTRYWGKHADRYGDRPIMFACGVMATLYPAFWFFINAPWQILFASVLSGFAWAGFDITSFNYLLDVTPAKHRPFYVSNFRLFANLGIVAGPIMGGLMAVAFQNTTFLWLAGLQLVFLVSFVLRGATIGLFVHRMKETRIRRRYHVHKLFWKVTAIYPVRGIMHEVGATVHVMQKVERKVANEERALMKGLAHDAAP